MPSDLTALKASIAVGAAALLLLAERMAPATVAGQATWKHDLRNLLIGVLNGCLGVGIALLVLPAMPQRGSGPLGTLNLGAVGTGAVAFLLLDLWMYVWHRLFHAIPWLWRVHRMHHSDEALDMSSAVRFHPFETLGSQLLRLPFAVALGLTATHVLVYEVVFLPVIFLHHSNLRVPARLDRVLRWAVVTPSLHRRHHSPLPRETNSNFGSVLSAWDRMAGTVCPAGPPERRFGLVGFTGARWQSVPGLLLTPFRQVPASAAPLSTVPTGPLPPDPARTPPFRPAQAATAAANGKGDLGRTRLAPDRDLSIKT